MTEEEFEKEKERLIEENIRSIENSVYHTNELILQLYSDQGHEILSRKEKEIAYQQGLEDGRKQGAAIDGSKRYWDGYHAAQKDGKKIYQQGLEDAWSAARKIMLSSNDCLKCEELEEIFGANMGIRTILKTFSASEAIEKIKEYEAKKTERNDSND